MKKVFFVTQNNYKFCQFIDAIESSAIQFEQLSKITPEIQAENSAEVAKFSAQWAAEQVNSSVICEDVGLYIEALSGFPGPYLSQVEKWLKPEGFLKLMVGEKNRKAKWEYAVAFCSPKTKPVSFSAFQEGCISQEAKGKSGWHTDKIFIPKGENKTIAELRDSNEYRRNQDHYQKLISYLKTA